MLAFNIPQLIVDTVISLFFYTRIQVNINGHLTDTRITQSRGLRQGDPLSPLLFNIAFDPFLRMVSQDHHLKGFNFTTELPSSHLPASFEYTLQRFDQLHLSDDAPNIDPSVGPSHDPPSVSPPSVKILAYADDALIFLKDTLDFLRLQQAVNIYSTASNALLNYNKTQAFSLSGDPHPQWQAFLAEHNITLWHDRNSPSHLTYLGFAICSGTSQRSHFANLLTQKIQHACFVHSQRQLSVRGKATVLNTLIYSRLWHVIRLFPFTKAQLQKIRSIGNSFINQGIFPKLSHDLICLDRSSGGLGVLDPSLQQQALQWRWLRPLLLFSDKIHRSSPCLPYLRYVLNWFYSSDTYPTYHWALLFPACRLSSWSPKAPQGNIANISQLSNLFTAVDAIPHIFDSCHLNADTCLRLPLLELVHHTRPQQLLGQDNFLPPSHFFKRNPSAKKLIGHDLFIFEPNTQTIRYRLPTETIRFRNTTITVLTLLKTKQLLLQNFLIVHLFVAPRIAQSTDSSPLIDLSSCITSLISTSDNPIVHTRFQRCSPASPQYYKSLIPQKLPPDLVVLPPNKWKFFWRLQIPFKARTVWYRLIHKKLPTKQILNRYILPLHPTPNCQICPAESPTLECIAHFAYLCPIKSAVWNQIITAFFPARLLRQRYPAILYRLQRLKIPSTAPLPSSPNPKLSLYQVFACTLQSIWQAHWRFVFDDVQPVSANITKATLTAIQRLDSILNYDLS
ncbi:hypothetical protein G6F40_006210 [Rhizopus arrhizus]|nr:hypothetical protein G6F40_006210 [Rhizopus arrhizus]